MLPASFNRTPAAFVLPYLSLPAKSTNVILGNSFEKSGILFPLHKFSKMVKKQIHIQMQNRSCTELIGKDKIKNNI